MTGFGAVEVSGAGAAPRMADAGVIRLDAGAPLAARLAALRADLRELLDGARPDVACVEAIFTHREHPGASITMAHARGVILLTLREAGIETRELAPAAVKKCLTGSGRAAKAQVGAAVAHTLGLTATPEPEDVGDALAIALAAALRLDDPAALAPA